LKTKTAVVAAILTLVGAPVSYATHTTGNAGAPGQVCKSLRVKGKKTPKQRADRKACVKKAAADRNADKPSPEVPVVDPTTPPV
jgi:hypothetical protein